MCIVAIVVLFICVQCHADSLLWSDEFNGSNGQLPDSSKWRYDIGGGGWGNHELQYYTNSASNAALDGNGNLVITARKENNNLPCWNGPCQYTSARLLTFGKFSHTYGAIEARIKIPRGNGIWPAFWMLGDDLIQVGWPQCGEIDILENVGKEPTAIHGTLHGPGYSGGAGLTSTYHLPNNKPFADDFHVYRADWTSNAITFSVDGHQYSTRRPSDIPGKKWVFNHNFFIILNLAVGGDWPGPPDSSTSFPQSLVVDYVKVYSKNGDRQGPIKGVGDRCVDVLETAKGLENGTPVQLFECSLTAAQNWTIADDGTIRVFDKCLDVSIGGIIDNETPVQIEDCNGSDAQKWTLSEIGNIVNGNKCLDVRERTTGMFLHLWDCDGRPNQEWTLPKTNNLSEVQV